MKPPTRQGKAKEMFWRKALERFAESGLTQVAFCKRENLNANVMSWWKREIALRDSQNADEDVESANQDIDRREVFWRQVIANFKSSGLSKDAFCTQQDLKPAAFSWWRAELERRDTARRKSVIKQSETFVPLTVTPRGPQPVVRKPLAIAEIDILTGTVRVFNTVDTDSLIALLRALRESAI